jgi:ubiquinone/menaquinone biosynthesis C-methylase UbiE
MTTESPTNKDFDQLKARLKATWSAGDYDLFSRYMEDDAKEFFLRLGVTPGTRLLDVGCGAGQLALIAARAGAKVTGCDIAPNWIEKAQTRAAVEGLQATFEVADAEALPYEGGQFDVVASLIGAMFAPRPDLVAAELTRVCRPGGKIAMANWTPGGFVGRMFKIIAGYIAPSGMPSPVLWGDEATVRERLRDGISDLQLTRRIYHFDYPFAPAAVVEFFKTYYGPMSKAFASLDAVAAEKLQKELVDLWATHNKAEGNATSVEAEYLEVIATRAASVSYRAGALANRIEEGAALLEAFAQGLSDEEWSLPVSATDRRPVGVIVHHVASVYPVEVDCARGIAAGKALSEVTWQAVAEMNANHARENGIPSRADTLRLLRKNSGEAAAAVRTFTDEELDRAAPFGLSYDAPVTAQFVIEDHALRHSWHHLAKIRKAVGK